MELLKVTKQRDELLAKYSRLEVDDARLRSELEGYRSKEYGDLLARRTGFDKFLQVLSNAESSLSIITGHKSGIRSESNSPTSLHEHTTEHKKSPTPHDISCATDRILSSASQDHEPSSSDLSPVSKVTGWLSPAVTPSKMSRRGLGITTCTAGTPSVQGGVHAANPQRRIIEDPGKLGRLTELSIESL
jgi:hypothetical protein